ncbi:MAG: nucleotidyltransferase domain-containing protein [Candidatus Helarchaeota archaeon]
MNLEKIRNDLKFLAKKEVVLYGSRVDENHHERSDIDIAVITRNSNKDENLKYFWDILGKAPAIYDIRIFELLPLKIKIEIADQFIVIFGDKSEISEYFYFYRKLWKDSKWRIESNQFRDSREKIFLIRKHLGKKNW